MICSEIQNQFDSLMEGGLSGEQARQVRAHVAGCATCRSRLRPDGWIEVLPALDDRIEPSEDIAGRFHARLVAHRATVSAADSVTLSRIVLSRLSVLPRQIAAVGTLAAFLFLGVYFGLYRTSAPGPGPGNGEVSLAENLPLLEDMGVIKNLDLLEDFDAIEDASADEAPPASVR